MVTLTVKISCVKKRLGFITKVQVRVAGREHLLLNHPPLDQKDPRTCSNSKSQFNQQTLSQCTLYNCTPTKSGECV